MKKRVTGLGGVFFKSRDPEKLKTWYKDHLHIDSGEYGAIFNWRHTDNPEGNKIELWEPLYEYTL